MTFQPHVDYAAGQNPITIAPADVNNDGVLDLAVLNQNKGFSTLPGRGDGTFSQGAFEALSPTRAGLLAADLDGNGWQDVVVGGSNNFSVFLGAGGGTFTCCNGQFGPGEPNKIATGDFNGDGIADLVMANNNGYVAVFFGNGDGTFQPAYSWLIAAQAPDAVVTGDFNNDGRLDIAVTDRLGKGIYVLLQDPMSVARKHRFRAPAGGYHQQAAAGHHHRYERHTEPRCNVDREWECLGFHLYNWMWEYLAER